MTVPAQALARTQFQQAQQAHRAGQLEPAERLYKLALAAMPDHVDSLHFLGLLLSQRGDYPEALPHLSRAADLSPKDAAIHTNLGEALRRLGRLEEAEQRFRHVIRLQPSMPTAHYNLGNALKGQGRLADALAAYERAVALKPDYAEAQYNLGNTLLDLGRYRSAQEAFEKTLRLNPKHALALNNLGIAHKYWDRREEAERCYRRALELKPDFADAIRNLAQLNEDLERHDEARAGYARLRELGSLPPLLALHAEVMCPLVFESREAVLAYRAGLGRTIDRYLAQPPAVNLQTLHRDGGEPPFTLGYHGEDDKPVKEKYARLFAGAFPQFEVRPGSGPPRIGMVVTHGHEGVFSKCMRGIVNRWPAQSLPLTLVCSAPNGEQILRRAITHPDVGYLSLPPRFDQAVEAIRAARFDVLYYWEIGTDALNYFLPHCRLAPVQTNTWGWPVTSGIPAVDWFISAETIEPEGADAHYSEMLVRLPHLPTYYHRPPVPMTLRARSHFGFDEHSHIYLCQQNLRKVQPDFDDLVGGILRADPKGVVAFINHNHPTLGAGLMRRIRARLPDVGERVRMLEKMDETDYLNMVAIADVSLDTTNYAGGANTGYDSFAAGTPVVTLPGRFHRGRYTTGAYKQIGWERCVTSSREHYVELAVALGSDRALRDEYSRELREASQPLFEDQRAVDELAGFFETAVAQAR